MLSGIECLSFLGLSYVANSFLERYLRGMVISHLERGKHCGTDPAYARLFAKCLLDG